MWCHISEFKHLECLYVHSQARFPSWQLKLLGLSFQIRRMETVYDT